MKLLDLFSGAGAAALGYSQAGFDEIVGVDIVNQPRYPFRFIRGDALALSLDFIRTFDLVHASPPCPRFSELRTAPNAKGDAHPDLITPTRAMLIAAGRPFCIENVEGAKKFLIDAHMLCGTSFGLETPPYRTAPKGFELQRHRLFEVSGFQVSAPPCRHSGRPTIGVYGGHCRDRRRGAGKNHRSGSNLPLEFGFAAMGVPLGSMSLTSLCDGIPPAFSKFIGETFLASAMQKAAE